MSRSQSQSGGPAGALADGDHRAKEALAAHRLASANVEATVERLFRSCVGIGALMVVGRAAPVPMVT